MSTTSNQEELQKKRDAMCKAGWVFAERDLPGAYVPGPAIRRGNPISRWVVSRSTINDLVKRYSSDPEVLAFFECDKE